MKQVNYFIAGKRHWDCAEVLMEKNTSEACMLYGYSAECFLKQILIKHQIASCDTNGNIQRPFKEHMCDFNKLKREITLRLCGRNTHGAVINATMKAITKFNSWQINFRYFSDSSIPIGNSDTYRDGVIKMKKISAFLL